MRRPTIRSAISAPATIAPTARSTRTTGDTFVFDNDFPALQPAAGSDRIDRDGLMVAEAEPGICRVICFSPRHDLTLARMAVDDIERVVEVWGEQYRALGAHRRHQRRADLREPRRDDGREQPASALPGVGDRHAAQRDGEGARRADRLLARARLAPALRLSEARAGGGRADRLRERAFHGAGAVLGDLAVRDDGAAAPSRRRDRRTDGGRSRRRWPRRCARSPSATTICSRRRSPIRWASTSGRPTARRTPNGSCMRTSIRRSCARRRCGSSWSASSCSARRSATSRRKRCRAAARAPGDALSRNRT